MAKALGVSHRVTVRLDEELREDLARFKRASGMNTAQAIRMALAVGVRQAEAISPESAYTRQAFKEGVQLGVAATKKAMRGMVEEAMADL